VALAAGGLAVVAAGAAAILMWPGARDRGVSAERPDARALIAATATTTLAVDAGPAAEIVDAAAIIDAAAVVDAAASRAAVRAAAPDPAVGLTLDEVRARYRELRGAWGAALEQNDLREARAIAERAIPFARRLVTPEPHQVIMVMSCRMDDERRARAAFARLPRDGRYLRQEMVAACRMHGMELGDLLE
jgi:hypothetical protein